MSARFDELLPLLVGGGVNFILVGGSQQGPIPISEEACFPDFSAPRRLCGPIQRVSWLLVRDGVVGLGKREMDSRRGAEARGKKALENGEQEFDL